MSARNRSRRAARLSAAPRLLTGLLLAVVLAVTGCGVVPGTSDTIRVTALMPDSAGLFEGNDVGVLGVPVGRVASIEPAGEVVRVELEIDADRKVPADAVAAVIARSVATDRYVELTPVWTEGPTLADGDEIAEERPRTPVDFDEVLEALEGLATGIGGDERTTAAVRRFIDAADLALRGNGALLQDTIGSLSAAGAGVSAQREQITETLVALDDLVGTVVDNQRTVRRFVAQVSDAAALLDRERGNVRASLDALDRAVALVAELAVDNRGEIVSSMRAATGLMETVLDRRTDLEEVLAVMPLALQNLQRAEDDGRLTVRLPATALLPLGDALGDLCAALPLDLCTIIGGTDPSGRAVVGPRRSGTVQSGGES